MSKQGLVAEHIIPGDILKDPVDGSLVYTVEATKVAMPHVIATVRFVDGGTAERVWEWGKQTPVVHP